MKTQRKQRFWMAAVMAAMVWAAGVCGNGWAQTVPASGPTGYIVQFVNPPIALQQAKSTDGRVQAKAMLESDHELFRQDVARIKQLPAPAKSGGTAGGPIRFEYYTVFNGAALTMSPDEVKAVQALPYVKAVYEDKPVHINDWSLADSTAWINADDVWALGATGAGIVVAVLDTGVDYTHPDLGGGFGPANKVIGGYDFIDNDSDPMDDNGHGTHVTGIVAANGALQGVAPDAKILAYKMLGANGSGSESAAIAAIERATDPDQNPATDDAADVINMSFGSYDAGLPGDAQSQAADAAAALGVVCVAGAGNRGLYVSVAAPACASSVLAVGATDAADDIANFSSRGPTTIEDSLIKPEICGPGASIVSCNLGGGTIAMDGTSMSCPHVSGAAALMRQLYPAWSEAQIRSGMIGGAVDIGQDVATQGAGRMDVLAAAQSEILFSPNPVNLGITYDEVVDIQKVLTVTNTATHSVTYTFSVETPGLPAGATASVSPSLTLGAGASGTVTLEITADASVPNSTDPPYVYYGCVVAQSPGHSVRAPFALRRILPDSMEPNNTQEQAAPISVTTVRQLVGVQGSTRIDASQPGASPTDEDWYQFAAIGGQKFAACIQQTRFDGVVPKMDLYGPSGFVYNCIFPESRIVTLPVDGSYALRVTARTLPPWPEQGEYRLFVNFLPNEVVSCFPMHDGDSVPFVKFGDDGNCFHATEIDSAAGFGEEPTNYQYLCDVLGSSAPTYSVKTLYPVFLCASRNGPYSAAVFRSTAANDNWLYDGSDWAQSTPDVSPGRRYGHALVYDKARGVTLLFGGMDPDGNNLNDTWTWDGSSWTELHPAHQPSPRFMLKNAVYDANRNIVVLYGGIHAVPNRQDALWDTWEWNGVDWSLIATITEPRAEAGPALAYDDSRGVTVMYAWTDKKTWEYDGTDWTLQSPSNTPTGGGSSTNMVYNELNSEILLLCSNGSQTWAWNGVNWIQKTSATALSFGSSALTYDEARDKVVLMTGPFAGDHSTPANSTYEWTGSDWTQIATIHAPTSRYLVNVAYDVARNRTICYGGRLQNPVSQELIVRAAPSSDPVYTEQLSYPQDITGIGISSDGARIVGSNNEGSLWIKDTSGGVLKTITPPASLTVESLSQDGVLAVVRKQTAEAVVYDLDAEIERPGLSITSGSPLQISDDGARAVGILGTSVRAYAWNGSAYTDEWQFTAPESFVTIVDGLAIAGNGSLVTAVGHNVAGIHAFSDASKVTYYFLNGGTGQLLHSRSKELSASALQGFIAMKTAVNEDGSRAVITGYSDDYRYPEIEVFEPQNDQPIFRLDVPNFASVWNLGNGIDLYGQKIAFGTGSFEIDRSSDLILVDLAGGTGEGEGEGEGEAEHPTDGQIVCTETGFIEEGMDVTLTAPPGTSHQWFKDGVEISGETNATLVFDSVTEEDGGTYVCVYDNGSKTVFQTEPFVLDVLPAGSLPVADSVWMLALALALLLTGFLAKRRLVMARRQN